MNEKQQIFEVINGFKNLASKIKKDNDEIKVSIKNKDTTIAACKKEYQKLYFEHEELKKICWIRKLFSTTTTTAAATTTKSSFSNKKTIATANKAKNEKKTLHN